VYRVLVVRRLRTNWPTGIVQYFGAVFIFRKDCYDFKFSGCYFMFYQAKVMEKSKNTNWDVKNQT